jgi:L-ascorbate metabolism protein UlaG (beta-lactamase superfamily)
MFLLVGCVQTNPPTDILETRPTINSTRSAFTPFTLPTVETFFDGVRVTFVGNEGVLITAGNYKILIDGIFHSGLPLWIQELLVNAQPPFDHLDLILVTHKHADHFDSSMVRQHLQIDQDAFFASNPQVTGQILDFKDRVISLDVSEGNTVEVELNGLVIKAINLTHGRISSRVINLGYLVSFSGIKLFHAGDFDFSRVDQSYLKPYKLSEEGIDIAFLPNDMLISWLGVPIVSEGIHSRFIIPIHYEYSDLSFLTGWVRDYYPEAIFFQYGLQSWVMP